MTASARVDRVLRRVRVADGHVEELASLSNYPNLGPAWSGITPDNSPLILRNLGIEEIYALTLESRSQTKVSNSIPFYHWRAIYWLRG